MNSYFILIALMGLAAGFAYINHKFIKMPFVIGLFFLSTILSLVVLFSHAWDVSHFEHLKKIIMTTDLSKFILEIMLGFLLFAGSLHTSWGGIKSQLKPVTLFSVLGVIFSTAIIGGLFYEVCILVGYPVDFIYCLVFGAIISPTDPIAVIGILTKANVSKKIEATIVGESLFNDGVGVVLFISLLEIVQSGSNSINFFHFSTLFVQEAIGGIIFGLALGYLLHQLLRSIDNYETEVLLTIAFVMIGYSLCFYFHISGALAMVMMGLLVGNFNTEKAMSDTTAQYVRKFWGLVDVILNAILFVSIAFVIVMLDFKSGYVLIGISSIFIALLARAIIIYSICFVLPRTTNLARKEARLVVWGGLRGGLSIALVLSLPESEVKPILMIATYACVVFSILVQGLTIERMAKAISSNQPEIKTVD